MSNAKIVKSVESIVASKMGVHAVNDRGAIKAQSKDLPIGDNNPSRTVEKARKANAATPVKVAQVAAPKADPFAQFATFSEIQAKKASANKGAPEAKITARAQAQAIVKDVAKGTLAAPPKSVTIDKALLKPEVTAPVKSLCLVNYAISEYARPKGGAVLFAFTAAWLEMFNMLHGSSVAQGALKQVCGSTAISYHTRIGNFEVNAKGHLALSAQGLNFFNARKSENKYSDKVKDAFIAIMTSGEIDGSLVKSKSALIKLAA